MEFGVFDAHADTISKIYESHQSLKTNNCHIDFKRIEKYPQYIQVFAMFADIKRISEGPRGYIEKLILKYKEEIGKSCLMNILKGEDFGKSNYSSILAIEGGEALEGDIQNLEFFYNQGVRILTLTWNYDNELGGGIGDSSGKGLSSFGKRVVRRMNEIGMTVDVSHISEKSFWNVADVCRKPFVASHSNVRKLCPHKRNLSDEQIKEIIKQNGVIGINFNPDFLCEERECKIADILNHIEYILDLGGENNVGIGSDFDGIDSLPRGMAGVESIRVLPEMMRKRGYNSEIINKIMYGNFVRVMKEIMR